jgi:hypothetical protein
MPYVVRPRKLRSVAAAVLASSLLLAAVPALASAACPISTTSQAFAQFGDNASYTLVQDGNFTSNAQGWTRYRAVVINNETIPTGGSHALAINDGSAVSPGFCVSAEYPTYRFLFRLIRGGGPLILSLRYTDGSGQHTVSGGSVSTGTSWTLSPVEQLAGSLTMGPDGTLNPVQLVFETKHSGLEYAITAVYIDPYRR